jgi:hypothetical protein
MLAHISGISIPIIIDEADSSPFNLVIGSPQPQTANSKQLKQVKKINRNLRWYLRYTNVIAMV